MQRALHIGTIQILLARLIPAPFVISHGVGNVTLVNFGGASVNVGINVDPVDITGPLAVSYFHLVILVTT